MTTIQDYINEIQEAINKDWERNKFTFAPPPLIAVQTGKTYHKIVKNDIDFAGTIHGKSVHCFVDMAGNIYKASGWNAPAKGIRGSIHNEKKPLLGGQFYRCN